MIRDFKKDDIIKFKGKSINSLTKGKTYIIFKREKISYNCYPNYDAVYFLDDKGREKG